MKRLLPVLLVAVVSFLSPLRAEEPATAYFVDGYHGGVYGHYPPGYTKFLVDQLEAHPEWKLNLEIEPATWDVARHSEPEAYARLQTLMRDQSDKGPIEIVNPTFAQSYFFQSSGESVIRQFEYGIRRLRQHFPDVRLTTYSSEEPCFTSCLPTVLTQFGYDYAVLKNPNTCWGGYTSAYGGELVNWVGPDGTKLLTVPRYECEALHPTDCWQTLASGNSRDYIRDCFEQGIPHPVGMCLQDAGWRGGPWLSYSARRHYRPTEYVTWRDYIGNITPGETDDDWHFTQEDVKPGLMWGAQVLQRIAQQSRYAEHRLLVAEKLSAMAYIETGHPRMTNAFDDAWHNVLLSQHHDCWIVPYNGRPGNTWADQVSRWTAMSNTVSDLAIENALEALLRSGRSRQRYVRLFNPTASAVDTVIAVPVGNATDLSTFISEDASGQRHPTQHVTDPQTGASQLLVCAQLAPMGYTTIALSTRRDDSEPSITVTQDDKAVVLESDLYRIVFDPQRGGAITSLKVKPQDNAEFVDQQSEQPFNSLKGHFYKLGGFRSSSDHSAVVRVVQQGPLRATVEITGTIADQPFVQRVSLTQGSPVIDCQVRIDWQGQPRIGEYDERDGWGNRRRAAYDDRFKLQVMFPTSMSNAQVVKNAPFDVCESKHADSFYNNWEDIKHNIILDWVDLEDRDSGRGLSLFSDHTTSYAYGPDDPLGLVIQYAGKGLWSRDYKVDGPTLVRYALVPHRGKWDEANIPATSALWQEPPLGAFSRGDAPSAKSLVDVGQAGWEVPAMVEENGEVLIRLFNSTGDENQHPLTLGFAAKTIELVDLNGKPLQSLDAQPTAEGRTVVELAIPRYGVRTIRCKEIQRSN